jgi:hypothetical protein
MTENTNSKPRDSQCSNLWGVIAKVRPKPDHPFYYEWQHGFLVIVLPGKNPESACMVARAIVQQLPYDLVGARVAVRHAEGLAAKCAGAVAGGQQLGLGLWLIAFATGSDEEEFEAVDFS